MKNIFARLLAPAAAALLIAACGKSDSKKDYGFPLIYIPQATVTGLDNSYPVPLGPFGQNSVYTCYYRDGRLNVAFGVVRAGAIANASGFTVDFRVSQAQTEAKLASLTEAGSYAQALDPSLCQIPSTISVEAGKNTGTTYLGIDLTALAARRESIWNGEAYPLLVLGVEIANPTAYELAEENTAAVLLLDLNSEYWDSAPAEMAESAVRNLFPMN